MKYLYNIHTSYIGYVYNHDIVMYEWSHHYLIVGVQNT